MKPKLFGFIMMLMQLRVPRWAKTSLWIVGSLLALSTMAASLGWVYMNPTPERVDGVQYGRRNGYLLTMDIFRPAETNGKAVVLLVSGSWKSKQAGSTPVTTVAPLLRGGYTVFALCHISQPDASVMEIVEDMHRGIRFIRHHAEEYGIDPNKIGVVGGSAGGHLALMLATRGGPGDPNAFIPADRETSAVQAVAIFFPVTDLLNLGPSTENAGDGGPPKSYRRAFGPNAMNMEIWKEIGRDTSPIYHVHKDMPPILIHHGDADTLVPLEQSQRFVAEAAKVGVPVELVVHPGKEHGWPTMVLDTFDFVAWFDKHL